MPNENPSLNSGEDWPYGYGMCCCGCGKQAKVVNGVPLKFYRVYHERWLLSRKQREHGKPTENQKQLLRKQKATRPNQYAISKHLPDAFQVSQSEVNKIYSSVDRGSLTCSEREKLFPHLNAPTVELKSRFKKAAAAKSELDCSTPNQPELFSGNEKPDRLDQQLAWIKANQPLLQAISRARSRVDVTVEGAYIRRREKVDVNFRLCNEYAGEFLPRSKAG